MVKRGGVKGCWRKICGGEGEGKRVVDIGGGDRGGRGRG